MVALLFSATPFLLSTISEELGMSIGATGLISTAQVGSFALSTFLAGRLFRPRRRLHYGALATVALSSLGAAVATNFATLLVTHFLAGIGLGILTWIAWADATRFVRGMGDVAAIGPAVAVVASPPIGWIVETGGFQLLYLILGVIAMAAVLLPVDFGDLPRIGRAVSPSKTNRVLLVALTTLSIGGSGVFVFTAASAGAVQQMTPVAMSWALSLNALTGVAATRMKARRGTAGIWIAATAGCAAALGLVAAPLAYFAAMALWGYAFWMAIPEVFRLLAERSLTPSERVGDAQAAMAVGRVIGPIIGGITLGAGNFGRLSVVGGMIIMVAAVTIAAVELYRR